MPHRRRTVVYEHTFLKELYELECDPIKADLFIEGVEQHLACAPDIGTQAYEGSLIWFLSVSELSDFPPLMIFYTFNESTVYRLSIRLQSEREESS